ncbi:hypothetical protein GGR57DRAFT_243244 [Xylariaceae sp. FL1272]|nr:hypothetical protein GGR57DRAFT_243244 [Xylariaceae sp. FL1272]
MHQLDEPLSCLDLCRIDTKLTEFEGFYNSSARKMLGLYNTMAPATVNAASSRYETIEEVQRRQAILSERLLSFPKCLRAVLSASQDNTAQELEERVEGPSENRLAPLAQENRHAGHASPRHLRPKPSHVASKDRGRENDPRMATGKSTGVNLRCLVLLSPIEARTTEMTQVGRNLSKKQPEPIGWLYTSLFQPTPQTTFGFS